MFQGGIDTVRSLLQEIQASPITRSTDKGYCLMSMTWVSSSLESNPDPPISGHHD